MFYLFANCNFIPDHYDDVSPLLVHLLPSETHTSNVESMKTIDELADAKYYSGKQRTMSWPYMSLLTNRPV